MRKNTEVAIKKYDIDKPAQVMGMARVLKNHIVSQKLYTEISGKNYAHVEGWQFAGGLLGLVPVMVSVERLSSGTECVWQAEVEIIERATGKVVSRGFAICSNKESKKKSFDEYAILSMAQTRAIGKAYRNLLGWVMKLAGYEGTPKEEMAKVDQQHDGTSDPVVQMEDIGIPCQYPKCKNKLTEAQAHYSKKVFKGKVLCKEHQDKINLGK